MANKKEMSYKNTIISIIFFMGILLLSCNNLTLDDIYKNENLTIEAKGKIKDIELYKGGGITLTISEDSGENKQIAVSRKFRKIVRKGDFFEKEKGTNKCIIKRNDSIIFLDCFTEIPSELRDSIEIEEWPKEVKGKWQIRK